MRQSLAIDHLRDGLWFDKDLKTWNQAIKILKKDSRIQWGREQKGAMHRDTARWTAALPPRYTAQQNQDQMLQHMRLRESRELNSKLAVAQSSFI